MYISPWKGLLNMLAYYYVCMPPKVRGLFHLNYLNSPKHVSLTGKHILHFQSNIFSSIWRLCHILCNTLKMLIYIIKKIKINYTSKKTHNFSFDYFVYHFTCQIKYNVCFHKNGSMH